MSLKRIDKKDRVVTVDGKSFLQEKTRSRKKFKLSKKRRDAISRSAKKFKLPIITTAINAPPLINLGKTIIDNMGETGTTQTVRALNALRPYSGVTMSADATGVVFARWKLKDMWATGLNLGNMLLQRMGLFRGVNRVLARAKVPARLW